MGRRTPIIVNGRREMLWNEVGDPIEEQDGAASNFHNPTTDLSTESEMSVAQNQPTSDEEQHRTAERDYWIRQLRLAKWMNWVTGVASVAGIVGLVFIYYTLRATQDQTQVAVDALRSQRPYISLGKADGTVAEYTVPPEGREKGTISLYFQNTGPVAAISFLVNAVRRLPKDHPLIAEQGKEERHIERWQVWHKGKPAGQVFITGSTIGSESIHREVLNAKWTPTAKEWELIESGQPESSFSIAGNFEYCDWWGKYHCETFDIDYRPAPLSRFMVRSRGCFGGFPSHPDPSDMAKGEGFSATLQTRCEQPEEREAKEKEVQ